MRVSNRFLNEGWVQEVPSGTINGVNLTFTLANVPDDAISVLVFLNGIFQRRGTDYTLAGSTISFITAPRVGQDVYCVYQRKT